MNWICSKTGVFELSVGEEIMTSVSVKRGLRVITLKI